MPTVLPVLMIGGGVLLVNGALTDQHPWAPVIEAFGGTPPPPPGGGGAISGGVGVGTSTLPPGEPGMAGPIGVPGGSRGGNRFGPQLVAAAQSMVGWGPYKLGYASVGGPIDCSGMTMLAYRSVGINLPHSAALQYAMGTKLPRASAGPGDLIAMPLGEGGGIHHVAMLVGPGTTIEAVPSRGGVGISPLGYQPGPYFYFRPRGA